jgi:hypothetical protein
MKRVRVARAGKELGEYTEDQVRQYLASGNLVPGISIKGQSDLTPLL